MLSTNRITRWGGAAFMLGGLLFLVNKINEMSRVFLSRPMPDVISGNDVGVLLVGQCFLIVGYLAFYRVFAGRARRFARNALRLFCGGGLVLAVGHVSFLNPRVVGGLDLEPVFALVLLGVAAMLVGLVLFGLANLHAPILGRWQWLPLATGIVGFVGFFFFSGEQITAAFLTFRTLFALGLCGLGLILFLEKPAPSETSEARLSPASA